MQQVKKLSSFLEFEQGLPPPDPWDIPRTLNEDLHDVLELSLATNGPAARTATPPVKTTAAPAPVQATTTMTTTTTTAPTYQARPQQPQPTPQQPLQYPVNSYYPPPAQLPTQQQQQQHVANYNFSGASYNDNPGGYQSLSHPHPPPQQQQHQTFQPQRPHHMGVATPFVQPSRPPVVVAESKQTEVYFYCSLTICDHSPAAASREDTRRLYRCYRKSARTQVHLGRQDRYVRKAVRQTGQHWFQAVLGRHCFPNL